MADAAVLTLVLGAVMLVAVPFAGLRQIGSAFLVLGIATAVVSDAGILGPSIFTASVSGSPGPGKRLSAGPERVFGEVVASALPALSRWPR